MTIKNGCAQQKREHVSGEFPTESRELILVVCEADEIDSGEMNCALLRLLRLVSVD